MTATATTTAAAFDMVMNALLTRAAAPPTVRHLREGESLPAAWELGFDALGRIDCSWVWVIERDARPLGCVVAAPCHGVAFLWRVVMDKSAPSHLLLRLLRQCVRDLRSRGCVGILTFCDATSVTQARFLRVISRLNSREMKAYTLVAAPLPTEDSCRR